MAGKKKNKKAATKGTNATAPAGKADTDLVQEAYEDQLKLALGEYFLAYINDPKTAEERFLTGLPMLRASRDRAMQLVQGEPTSK